MLFAWRHVQGEIAIDYCVFCRIRYKGLLKVCEIGITALKIAKIMDALQLSFRRSGIIVNLNMNLMKLRVWEIAQHRVRFSV